MQESSPKNKSKAIEQALASLHFDNINVTSKYLEQYAQKQEVELDPTLGTPSEQTEEKGMVMKLTRKEGNNGNE